EDSSQWANSLAWSGSSSSKPTTRSLSTAWADGTDSRTPASVDDKADTHVDPPLGHIAVFVRGDLDLVDPGAADVLDRTGNLFQARLDSILDPITRPGGNFYDLGNITHDDSPPVERST